MISDLAAPVLRYFAIGAAMFSFGRLAFMHFAFIEAKPPWRAALISVAASVAAALVWSMGVKETVGSLSECLSILWITTIGRAWIIHIGAAAFLPVAIVAVPRRYGLLAMSAAISLLTFSAIGHASAAEDVEKYTRLALQSGHLLGAGFWVGALPLLIEKMRSRSPDTAEAVASFTKFATIAVATLIAAALGNFFFLTGGLADPLGETYSFWIIIKLGLVMIALALAGLNRFLLAPWRDFRGLAYLAKVELALLIAVIAFGVTLALSAPWS